MLGGRLQNIAAAMPIMNGYGLFVGLTTCAGKLNISMSSCDSILPDPEKLGDCMEQSFEELLSVTRKKNARKEPAARKARTGKTVSRKQNRKTH